MTGLFGSLRRVISGVLELAQVRLSLLATELEQEKLRLVAVLIWAAVAILLLGIGLLMLALLVLAAFWDSHRLAATLGLALAFLGAAALAGWRARQRLQSPGGPFALSLGELKRDREGLDAQRDEAPRDA